MGVKDRGKDAGERQRRMLRELESDARFGIAIGKLGTNENLPVNLANVTLLPDNKYSAMFAHDIPGSGSMALVATYIPIMRTEDPVERNRKLLRTDDDEELH
jgi:hypothetical protein